MLLLIVTVCSMISMLFISESMHDITRPAVGAQEPFSIMPTVAVLEIVLDQTGNEVIHERVDACIVSSGRQNSLE